MGRLEPYFFKSLPDFFKIQDSYKDAFDKGLLERFLGVFEQYSDITLDHITPGPTDVEFGPLSRLLQPEFIPPTHLNFHAGLFGYPPNTFNSDSLYRTILELIMLINRFKGTQEGVRRFFAAIGVTASIEVFINEHYLYDDGHNYDEGLIYDKGQNLCTPYTLHINDPDTIIPLMDPEKEEETLKHLGDILKYLLPIHLRLLNIGYTNHLGNLYMFENLGI